MPCASTGRPCFSSARGQAGAGVGVDVDEPGRDVAAGGVEHRGRRRRRQVADRGDAVAGDADVGAAGRAASAVDHLAAADEHVEAGLRARRRRGSTKAPMTATRPHSAPGRRPSTFQRSRVSSAAIVAGMALAEASRPT